MTMRDFASTPEKGLPTGLQDFLPVKAAKLDYLNQTLQAVYARWGCRPLALPSLEFYDMLGKGMGDGLRGNTFRLDDRQSGQLVAFAPDMTPQVARVVATRMDHCPLPLRLSYSGRVLRHTEQQSGKDREIQQSGVELFGLDSPEADAEMIAMAIEAFQAVGATRFTVDIGHAEFFRGALAQLPDDAQLQAAVAEAIVRKDSTELGRLLNGQQLTDAVRNEILVLPKLYGGREVLDKARAAVKNARSQAALDNLERVLDILDVYDVADHVSIDLGEMRALNYHTGVIFQGYLSGLGRVVLQGGRYDNLTAGYGTPMPATGFTFNLFNLLYGLENELAAQVQLTTDVLVYAAGLDKRPAQRAARALRQRGYSAARDMVVRGEEETLVYAKRSSFRFVLMVEEDGHGVRLINVETGSEKQLSLNDLQAPDFHL